MIIHFSITSCIWAFVVGATLCYAIYLDHKDLKDAKKLEKYQNAKHNEWLEKNLKKGI